jgi:transposase
MANIIFWVYYIPYERCSMPRRPIPVQCTNEQIEQLHMIVSKQKAEKRLVERARIILKLSQGDSITSISHMLDVNPNTVKLWRNRFNAEGIIGLMDKSRSGKPKQYGKDFRNLILKTLEEPPPNGLSVWDGATLAKHLDVSPHAVWRLLKKEGICLARQRSWCVSTDPEFAAKSADIIGLYLNPPVNALVLSVDEKPSIQALERNTGYVKTSSGKIVQGYKSTYKRNGTLNLFAALEIATGTVHAKTTQHKRRPDFQEFMDEVVSEYSEEKEIHVILDNYCIHKKNDEWLEKHPNVSFHFTPTSASWLNQVEVWFGIFSRKSLRNSSFSSTKDLSNAIKKFVDYYNQNPKPFVWRKREVKGTQLRNTINNLCN